MSTASRKLLAQGRPATGLDALDPVWARMRQEAEAIIAAEPTLAAFILRRC